MVCAAVVENARGTVAGRRKLHLACSYTDTCTDGHIPDPTIYKRKSKRHSLVIRSCQSLCTYVTRSSLQTDHKKLCVGGAREVHVCVRIVVVSLGEPHFFATVINPQWSYALA